MDRQDVIYPISRLLPISGNVPSVPDGWRTLIWEFTALTFAWDTSLWVPHPARFSQGACVGR